MRHRMIAFAVLLPALSLAACADEPGTDGAAPGAEAVDQIEAEADADPTTRLVAAAGRTDSALAERLQAIHSSTEKYRDVEVALADGYIRDPMNMCVTAEMEGMPPQLGEMGIHYFRPDLVGITATEPRVAGVGTHTDFETPATLIYEPQADGSLELVAVENLVFEEGWRSAGERGVPEFMGNQYYHMVDNSETDADEAHGFMPHYELHMWLYRENPAGLFAQFNTNVTCSHHVPQGEGAAAQAAG